ncbi:hypothetical protein HYW58_02385 [Candidatus Kaiserbacteria bacterium]|nr:hypothetical protein [Candidatus Kaiserbacteria bacterium]
MKERKGYQGGRGGAGNDLILVAGIVLMLGVLWVLSGGPSQGTEEGVLGFQNISRGEGVISSIDSFFTPIQRGEGANTDIDREYERIREEFGDARDFGEPSPYQGLIAIEKSEGPLEITDPKEEYIALETSQTLKKPISITGWSLQSMITKKVVTIPEATKVSTSGDVNIEQAIVLSPRDKVYLLTGHSPIGTSFQINKCSGYFEQFQDFTPPITKQCPLAEDELRFANDDAALFGGQCLSFIENISRCTMPLDALPDAFPDSCHLFITEKINYNTCVKNHRTDADFFTPEWRVYLKYDTELWGQRDIIRLLDENGKTVDVFSY